MVPDFFVCVLKLVLMLLLTDSASQWDKKTQLGTHTHADKWNTTTVEMSEEDGNNKPDTPLKACQPGPVLPRVWCLQ